MVSRATKAGILGIISLVIPFWIEYDSSFFGGAIFFDWTVFSAAYFNKYGTSFGNITQYSGLFLAVCALLLVLVLVGSILLLALKRYPKVGASLLLVAMLIFVAYIIYGGLTYGFDIIIPFGFFLVLVGAILGFTAKAPALAPTPGIGAMTTSDKLIKLKALLDSGAITKEEFEEQKKSILQNG